MKLLQAFAIVTAKPDVKAVSSGLLKSGGDESAYIGSYTNCKECPPTLLSGLDVPADFPKGTYFRNGGGKFVAEDRTKVLHPFDGDGMISALTFNGEDEVVFRSKFVETDDMKKDREIGGFSAKGVFGTPKSGGFFSNLFDMTTKHVANTNAILAGEKLFALWEGGVPYEMDPVSLNTIGKVSSINENFSAHPRYDPDRDVWVNFGVGNPDPVSGKTDVYLFEIDGKTGLISSPKTCLEFPGVVLMHDCALTKDYLILGWNLCNLDSSGAIRALLGLGSLAGSLQLDQKEDHLMICVPRSLLNTGETIDALKDPRIKRISAAFSFSFHFGNAYEDDNGNIVLDRVETDDRSFDFGTSMMKPNQPVWETVPWDSMEGYKLVRYLLDPVSERVLERIELTTTGSVEFPTIPTALSTKQHNFLYTVASHEHTASSFGFPGSYCKVRAATGEVLASFRAEPYETIGEPCFVPQIGSNNEDDGYLLAYIVNGRDKSTDVAILETSNLACVSRARLPEFLTTGLHGRFFEEATYAFNLGN